MYSKNRISCPAAENLSRLGINLPSWPGLFANFIKTPNELIIFGIGGQAKVVAQLARQIDADQKSWQTISYVSKDCESLGHSLPFGNIAYYDEELLQSKKYVDAVMGVGYPTLLRAIFERFKNTKFNFVNLILSGVYMFKSDLKLLYPRKDI
jgi:hypothetical protein